MDYLKKRCDEENKVQRTLAPETIKLFQSAPWEGNVRELQHVIEQIILLSDDIIVTPSSLPENFLERITGVGGHSHRNLESLIQKIIESGSYSKAHPLIQQVEAILAKKMVDFTDGKAKAAELLGRGNRYRELSSNLLGLRERLRGSGGAVRVADVAARMANGEEIGDIIGSSIGEGS